VQCSEKRVFDIHVANVYSQTNMNLVRDAYHSCHMIKNKQQREACYLVYGLDEEKVEYYYPVVENMEKIYHKRNPVRIKFGFVDITLFNEN